MIALECDGEAREFVGGYYDYVRQRGPQAGKAGAFGVGSPYAGPKKPDKPKPLPPKPSREKLRLTFNE